MDTDNKLQVLTFTAITSACSAVLGFGINTHHELMNQPKYFYSLVTCTYGGYEGNLVEGFVNVYHIVNKHRYHYSYRIQT